MDKMTDIQFIEALNDCINRLNDGQSLESCLAAYPQYADQLEGLLQTGELVHQATYAEDQVSAAKKRTLQRINTTMHENRNGKGAKKRRKISPFRLLAGVAVTILFVGFGLVLFLISGNAEPLDTQLTATQIVQLNATTEMQIQATQVAAQVTPLNDAPTVTKTPFGTGNQGGGGGNGSGGIVGIPATGTVVASFPSVVPGTQMPQPTAQPIDQNAVAMTATSLSPILQPPTIQGTAVIGGQVTTALPDVGGGSGAQMTEEPIFHATGTSLPTSSPAPTTTAMPQGTPVAMTTFLPTVTITTTPIVTVTSTVTAQVTSTPIAQADIALTATALATILMQPTNTPPPTSTPQPPVAVDTLLDLPEEEFLARYSVNPFTFTDDDNLSTFSMDVDTASYTLTRNYLRDFGQFPPAESMRPEEFINFFDANYDPPTNPDEAFSIQLDAAPAPFGIDGDYLMRVGIQGREIAPEDRDPALLIFVIDVSGSMDSPQKLGLVKDSLRVLVDELGEDDRVGIVIYASNTQPILNPTPASEKATIMAAIDNLRADGSTYAEAGLRLGYSMAEANMREGETTRIILLSDGVANVGVTGPDAILEKVNEGVEAGITLSTIGFGMGGFNDFLMEQLANDGNGNYYYIDNIREARRIFVNNLTGTLQVIGYDAKIQVEFSPEITERYRLIGYENRAVADVDFRNDTVDAAEIGAGHSITALYEIALFSDDPNQVIATVYIRYQDAETREVVEISQEITTGDLLDDIRDAPPSFRLQAGVAEFAELLRGSIWAQNGSYSRVLELVQPLENDYGGNPQIMELVELIRLAIQYGGR